MIRPLALLALLAALCLSAAPAAADALLRTRAMVEGDTVTLGDLFDNVGDKGAKPVLHAPAPGKSITVDSEWLSHVATINGIAWHPRDLFEEAVIERTGVVIGREQIMASLQEALQREGAPADASIESDARLAPLVVPVGTAPQLLVRDLFYDRDGNRFSATVTVPNDKSGAARLLVNGKLFPTTQIPVLSRPVARGEMITAEDVTWLKMRKSEVRPSALTDIGAIVGLAPKQQLRAGQALTAAELQKPLAVARGALVVMVLSYGGMSLTAQGRAIDQGSLGDVIHVTNTHSNLTVEGTIDGPNHLRVSLNGPIALAN